VQAELVPFVDGDAAQLIVGKFSPAQRVLEHRADAFLCRCIFLSSGV